MNLVNLYCSYMATKVVNSKIHFLSHSHRSKLWRIFRHADIYIHTPYMKNIGTCLPRTKRTVKQITVHQNKTLFNAQLLRSIASSLSHPSSPYHRHYTNELLRHRNRGIVIAPSTLTSMVR